MQWVKYFGKFTNYSHKNEERRRVIAKNLEIIM